MRIHLLHADSFCTLCQHKHRHLLRISPYRLSISQFFFVADQIYVFQIKRNMTETGKRANNATISDLGIKNATAFWNLSPANLAEIAIKKGQASLTSTGAINIKTGEFTGRSPKDRFIVLDNITSSC
jgi:hypothetical protein